MKRQALNSRLLIIVKYLGLFTWPTAEMVLASSCGECVSAVDGKKKLTLVFIFSFILLFQTCKRGLKFPPIILGFTIDGLGAAPNPPDTHFL